MSFSFGAPATAAPAATGGFNFGAAPAPSANSFSFGATAAPAPAANNTSGFSFGGSAPAASAAPATAPTSSFSFGNAAPAASTGFSFGSGNATQPAKPSSVFGQTTGFGFGSAPPAAAAAAPANTFACSGFGTPAAPTPTPTGFSFGSTPAPQAPAGTSAFGTAPAAVPLPSPPIICGADAAVAQLNTIKAAYDDPTQSRFKFLLYNAVDPTQRHLYVRPPHISERQWTQAELDNPDPQQYAPAPVVGFDDLLKRIKVQHEHALKYDAFANDLRTQLTAMTKATRATDEKLEKCRHAHVQLFHTLVKVMKDIELLQNYGKPLQRNEVDLARMLQKLQTLLDAPAQYKARLHDAVALQRIHDAKPVASASAPANVATSAAQMSANDLQRVYQFLDKQRQGLEHLTSIVNDDLADMKLIQETWRR